MSLLIPVLWLPRSIINSSVFLNNKCQWYLPPKILQCIPFVLTHTPTHPLTHTHTHTYLNRIYSFLRPPHPFLSALWGRLMTIIKSHSVFPLCFEWPHQFKTGVKYWRRNGKKGRKGNHASLKYLLFHSVLFFLYSAWIQE